MRSLRWALTFALAVALGMIVTARAEIVVLSTLSCREALTELVPAFAEALGIAEAMAAKRVAPRPGELVGAVIARGEAELGMQQVSELLPVAGIQMLGPLPPEFRQTILYAATAFPQSTQRDAAQAFVAFLRSDPAREILRTKGLDAAE